MKSIAGIEDPVVMPKALFLDKCPFDHIVAQIPMPGFAKAGLVEQATDILEHGRTAAQHETVVVQVRGWRPRSSNSLPLAIRSVMRPLLRNGSRVTVG